jgi:hypothetical protein
MVTFDEDSEQRLLLSELLKRHSNRKSVVLLVLELLCLLRVSTVLYRILIFCMFYFFLHLSILKVNCEMTFLHFVFCFSDLLLAQDGVIKEVIAIQVQCNSVIFLF